MLQTGESEAQAKQHQGQHSSGCSHGDPIPPRLTQQPEMLGQPRLASPASPDCVVKNFGDGKALEPWDQPSFSVLELPRSEESFRAPEVSAFCACHT